MKNYIEEFLNDQLISIELLKSKTERKEYHRKSFKFVTWFKHYDAVYNMDNWPAGTVVKRFNMNDRDKENKVKNRASIVNGSGKKIDNTNQTTNSVNKNNKNCDQQLENVNLNTFQMECINNDNMDTTSGTNKEGNN